VVPDVYVLGKALGIMPLSAVVANRDVLGAFLPGEHGSTFGGNPLAVRSASRSPTCCARAPTSASAELDVGGVASRRRLP
jgi:acetylornithine/succinyldiaminopimelate/putrescine aminotransferase